MALHIKSMEASMAGVWGPKYASYTITFVIGNIIVDILTCSTGLFSFSKATPFGVWGGPEKDRNVCVFVVVSLRSFSPDSSCQLDVFWHDGDSPGVDSTQIGVFEQPHEIGLCCFLETQYGC